ncbi:MAG: Imidazole glycerol phosphate synthase subunit hisH, partial [Massilibacillus sp.]|nr:Imidazole glycerol phosphate synthase subunit hisH [Massilibacillus sp.]
MIAIIDYGMGNLFSVEKAFVKLGAEVVVTSEGAFGDCMKNLETSGLIPIIMETAASGKPFLGICLGLQVMFEGSEEAPGIKGLGIFKGLVKKIVAPKLKIPHMGWNSLKMAERSPLLDSLPENPYVYFVHSFHAVPSEENIVTAFVEYGGKVTAAVGKKNVQAMQFH